MYHSPLLYSYYTPIILPIVVFVSFLPPSPHSRYSDRSRNKKEYETSARKITGVALRSFGPARSVLFVYGSPVDGKKQPETCAAAQSVFAQVDGRRVQFKRGDRASLGEIQEYRIGY